MSSILLLLDTKDSVDPSRPHDAVFNLNAFVKDDAFHAIKLKSVTFLNARYNIHSGNNTLVFQEDGVSANLVATLTPQNYSATQLATELKTQLDAAGANTYTVTYNAQTLQFTIATSGTSIKITGDSTCLREIGFTAQTTFQASSTTSDLVVRLDGTQYVSVVSGLQSRNLNSNKYTNILARVPVEEPVGTLIHYEVQDPTPQQFTPGTLTNFSVRLFDDRDNLYVLPSNCQIQYIYELSHHIH